ncbi:hypothetical protein C0995_015219, partial [Termitomyces sp. Mi166
MFTVTDTGDYAGMTMAACEHNHKVEQCKFWICFDKIIQHVTLKLQTCAYPPCETYIIAASYDTSLEVANTKFEE